MKICEMIMPEIRIALAECNFTEEEEQLFMLRCRDIPLEECAERMNMSVSTTNRIYKRVKDKVKRIEMYQGESTRGIAGSQD